MREDGDPIGKVTPPGARGERNPLVPLAPEPPHRVDIVGHQRLYLQDTGLIRDRGHGKAHAYPTEQMRIAPMSRIVARDGHGRSAGMGTLYAITPLGRDCRTSHAATRVILSRLLRGLMVTTIRHHKYTHFPS